ncbi:hypothetical protein ENKNEFLB_03118 [Nocardioides aquaticus]|uniref:Uncharacterized protein n=1 Tax=Nocardioides aquaticus TaxID=160826 RepID=A0ABX8EPM9_9ACTN|nr:hypothetical protein [Nocardioides aquaticus]QVT80718.1 hypothetical protein ENKNEFLB_03118 [Nocardioides aquaticus]
MSSPGTPRPRPRWRVALGVLLVLAGVALFVALQINRDGSEGAGLDGLLSGLVVALGVVALQRPQR